MQDAKPLLPVSGFDETQLLAPAQALTAFFAAVTLAKPREEYVALDAACGRILARDVAADADYPMTARSSMDGFAVASDATPGRLRIVGEVRMGDAWASAAIERGSAVRIPTGGVLPPGTDAVVPVEDVVERTNEIELHARLNPGDCVVPAASDMTAGNVVLRAGRVLGAGELGVLAALGVVDVPVFARPRFAVLSSGDEIVEPGRSVAPGQIRDSNRYAIAASLRAMGAEVVHGPTVRDEPGLLAEALRASLATCDGAVVSGGSSVGARDFTPDAVAAQGRPGVVVHGLRVKPGKPTVLGAAGGKPVVGIPGNPVSALLILEAVAAPIVAATVGARIRAPVVEAALAQPLTGRVGWTWYVPVALTQDDAGGLTAHPLPLRSAQISLPTRAAGYVVIGERDGVRETGMRVRVRRFLTGGNPVS